jgi:hypothetical protein
MRVFAFNFRFDFRFVFTPNALALMEATSSCGGVRHKRYSVQQEKAPHFDKPSATLITAINLFNRIITK